MIRTRKLNNRRHLEKEERIFNEEWAMFNDDLWKKEMEKVILINKRNDEFWNRVEG